jgi:hypothetical protein
LVFDVLIFVVLTFSLIKQPTLYIKKINFFKNIKDPIFSQIILYLSAKQKNKMKLSKNLMKIFGLKNIFYEAGMLIVLINV